jgi:hypothetical protein
MKRALFLALAFCVGCGDDGSGGGGGGGGGGKGPGASSHACTMVSGGQRSCTEYPSAYSASQVQQVCEVGGGTFSAGGCSHTSLAGSCSLSSGGLTSTLYYYAPTTTEEARQSCAVVGGAFTPGSGGGKMPSSKSCLDDDGHTVANDGVDTRVRYRDARVAAGEVCQSETQTRTCSGGTWGVWSGTFAAEECTVAAPVAKCGGEPTACASISDSSACYRQSGCSYQRGGCSGPSSTYSCSQLTWRGSFACSRVRSCYWIGDSCNGTVYYNLLSESECSTLSLYTTADWTDSACTGTAERCDGLSSQFLCEYQQGCSWK